MKNRILMMLSLTLFFASCKIVKPFFVKNEKKEERKDKKTVKKIEKKIAKSDTSKFVNIVDSLNLINKDTVLVRNIINYRNIDYQTIQMKAKIHYESADQKQSFNIHFRIKKDELIWASITVPIVGELARAIITPDSVKAIDRFNKKFYLYSFEGIKKLINIDVDFLTLQQIIIGNPVATQGEITEVKRLNALSSFIIKSDEYINQLTYNNSDTTLKLSQLQTTRPISTSSILMNFDNYNFNDNFKISQYREYHIQDVKGASVLFMDINKIDMNKELDFPFSIPANYKFQKN